MDMDFFVADKICSMANLHQQDNGDTLTIETRREIALIQHASYCQTLSCTFPKCLRVRKLIRHKEDCMIGIDEGDCSECMEIWDLLKLHAKYCNTSDPECEVHCCRAMKAELAKAKRQSNLNRRAEVMGFVLEAVVAASNSNVHDVHLNLSALETCINEYII
ncbi:hypothetical protein HN873_028408 [Arachis hypogaea]|uniref:histone acetyltransferase n=2 Tax=Arachis hypogaea TaxID=3818 RepID=A0A445BN84_ARAHY|nr:hypothetical protein Ahy_A09g045818 [Arachis hypogaea]